MAALLVARADGSLISRVDLSTRRVLSIGRSPRADLTLASSAASRRHALLFRHGRGWRLVDLGSRHGLHGAQGPCTSTELDARTWCRIGGVHLWLDPEGAASQVPAPPDASEAQLLINPDGEPGPVATILDPRDRPLRRVALRGLDGLIVGSDATCDVVVPDPAIAALHAILYREETRWCVADAGDAAGGVLVDGRRARRHRLHGGAVIGLGAHRAVISGPLLRPSELDELLAPGRAAPASPEHDDADEGDGTVSAFLVR